MQTLTKVLDLRFIYNSEGSCISWLVATKVTNNLTKKMDFKIKHQSNMKNVLKIKNTDMRTRGCKTPLRQKYILKFKSSIFFKH